MNPDTQWIDIPVPGGVERISRHAWDAIEAQVISRAEFDRETAYAKGAVYGMAHEREKIAQELEGEYRRLVADWNQGIGTFDRACAAQFSADFVRRVKP